VRTSRIVTPLAIACSPIVLLCLMAARPALTSYFSSGSC
jgi:hypothetical protein